MWLNKVPSDIGDRVPDPARLPGQAWPAPVERHGYRPAGTNRWIGLLGTAAIYAMLLAGFFFTISPIFVRQAPTRTLTVMEIRPPASPPEAPPRKKEPKPVEKKETPRERVQTAPVKQTIPPIPSVTVSSPVETMPVEIAPKEPETSAPKTVSAPPAPQVSNNGRDTWEGRVLAQLNKYRRYPSIAMLQRKQGVPWIRFIMNREGKVLSVRLERSSGVPDLDREAVALPKRAQPLPTPPDNRPDDTLELVVPVEFFLR